MPCWNLTPGQTFSIDGGFSLPCQGGSSNIVMGREILTDRPSVQRVGRSEDEERIDIAPGPARDGEWTYGERAGRGSPAIA